MYVYQVADVSTAGFVCCYVVLILARRLQQQPAHRTFAKLVEQALHGEFHIFDLHQSKSLNQRHCNNVIACMHDSVAVQQST